MTAVPYLEMLGRVWKRTGWRGHRCQGCHRELLEMAEGCWVQASNQTAQCPADGWHKP